MAQNSNITKELERKVKHFIRLTLKDISVELGDEFDRNFEREAFFNDRWARRKHDRDPGRAVLTKTGILRKSIKTEVTETSVIFSSNVHYAKVHNDGYRSVQYVKPFKRKRLNASNVSSRQRVRVGGHNVKGYARRLVIPKRQFIGMHPEVERIIREIVETNSKKIF